jgi:phosphomannomutase
MNIPREVFKAYDIRGLVDEQITPDLAEAIGRGYASLLRQENENKHLSVVVGRDMRDTSPDLQEALTRGLTESGVDVLDIGLVSTPAFYFAVGDSGVDGGIMVSASHNPAAYNGFKLTREEAVPIGEHTGIQDIADIIEDEDFIDADEKGSVERMEGVPERAVDNEMMFVGTDEIGEFKIVADSGNGMGAQYLDELFDRLDCDVERMYWELDGTFPNHEPNPLVEENVEDLKERVVDSGADLGIATDGDGDRIFFIDDNGDVLPPEILRGLLAEITLRKFPEATVCYDIRPGKITEDMIKKAGGEPCVTRVGHSFIKAKMRDVDAVFGGESSGHFFYAFDTGVYEGPVTAAVQLLQELTREGVSLSELVEPYKKYSHSGEINFEVEDKQAATEAVKQEFSDGEVNELDGITITFDDFWFNIRPSNTEPVLRLNLEAVNDAVMREKRDEIAEILESHTE